MRATSKFETAVLLAIGNMFPEKLPNLKLILENIRVTTVENTGVGAFVRFDQLSQDTKLPVESGELGYDGEIEVDRVESGLGAVLDISEGKLNHLELFTYGEEQWDGNTLTESFVVKD